MSDLDRTPAKDEADAALDAAVQQWAEAYDLVDPDDVITEYVVAVAAQSFSRPRSTRYAMGSRHDTMPWHHVMGLIEMARQQAEPMDSDEGWIEDP